MSDHLAGGYEHQDVDIAPLTWFAVWLAVGIVACAGFSWWLFTAMRTAEIAAKKSDYDVKGDLSKSLAPIIKLEGIEDIPPQVKPNPELSDLAMRKWLAQWRGDKKPTPPEFLTLPTDSTSGRGVKGGGP